MRSARALSLRRTLVLLLASVSFTLLVPATAQNAASPVSPEDFQKYYPLLNSLGPFFEKIRSSVQYPPPRSESRLLPLLPDNTIVYAAIPNYGEAAHQTVTLFHEELKDNDKLRAWWQQGEVAKEGPKIEDGVERFYQLSQYLGDEIVVAAASSGKEDPRFVLLAEIRKPGLKEFLSNFLKTVSEKPAPSIRVLDLAELATAKENTPSNQATVLVRPDFVLLGENLATLRRFNAQLELKDRNFASTEFGRRMAQTYAGGATIVAGADLQTILKKSGPDTEQGQATLERTGFSDMKYLVWEHKTINGQQASQFELSFTGPRRGVASWLAAPGPMDGLDFASPKALFLAGLLLKDPAQVFDDITDLATASNPNALASLSQAEQGLNLSFRNDLFAHLSGEITLELDTLPPQDPAWRILLKAKDPSELLATLRKFFTASRMVPTESDEDGVVYHTLRIPSQQKTVEICYAIVDGYLIVASRHDSLAESIRMHRGGGSLAKSPKFLAALPPSPSGNKVSALFYEDPVAMGKLNLMRFSPQLAQSVANPSADVPPAVIAAYGEEAALREVSRAGGADIGVAMVVAAVAIPNLMRARIAANESSAVGMVRTANTAQITYSVAYPQRGYARDFASLGSNPNRPNDYSPFHAGLIDRTLGNPSCTSGSWCTKDGYRFTITTAPACKLQKCRQYVLTATPVSTSTGTRSFCSISDAVVRFQAGPSLTSALTAAQCRAWPPLQ